MMKEKGYFYIFISLIREGGELGFGQVEFLALLFLRLGGLLFFAFWRLQELIVHFVHRAILREMLRAVANRAMDNALYRLGLVLALGRKVVIFAAERAEFLGFFGAIGSPVLIRAAAGARVNVDARFALFYSVNSVADGAL